MINMFNSVVDFFNFNDKDNQRIMTRRQREIEDYLAQSVDRCDLERRERELERMGYFKW